MRTPAPRADATRSTRCLHDSPARPDVGRLTWVDNGSVAKRSYGTGSLFTRHGNWYGQWRAGGQLVKRKLGPVSPARARA